VTDFFPTEPVRYGGPDAEDELAYRVYDPDRIVLGKRMEDQLRIAVCYWHSFNWPGNDVFGVGTFDRPWLAYDVDPMKAAHQKMDAAFEFFTKLGTPFFCFHDIDIAPAGDTHAETKRNLEEMVDYAEEHMAHTGVRLLWGTTNAFGHPRFAAGAATNPDPGVFAYAAAQVKNAIDATHRLGGANYVLWGGRDGYETLLNTRMRQEADQFARFLHLVVDYKHDIGFEGTLLIEPKPQEPTKHQYDFDVAACHAFLEKYDLVGEVFVNIEVNHATLSGHDFAHEVAVANAAGIFGSIDANAGDDRLGWDVDRFPVSVEQMTLGMYEILRGGGFTSGGLNFDAKLRRQSIARNDLFHAHIGGMDTMARALLAAQAMLDDGALDDERKDRYAGWRKDFGKRILRGDETLVSLRDHVRMSREPQRVSGRQEMLENLVARYVERAR